MNKRIVLGLIGVRAVGKTTVIEELVSHLNIQIISLGEEIKAYSIAKTNKEFFEHDFDKRDEIRCQLGKLIAARLQKMQGIILLDMHLADYREGMDKLIQPLELLRVIDGFIFLDASDRTILQRRKKDPSRGRVISVKELSIEREQEQLALERAVRLCGLWYWFVSTEGTLQATCQKILKIIKLIERRKEKWHGYSQDPS